LRFLLLLFLFTYSLFANLVNLDDDTKDDLNILYEMDIEPEFITDLELQSLYYNFTLKGKDYFVDSYNNSLMIIPTIKSLLVSENVPASMLFLGMAESNFDMRTKSNMGAKGLWQFIPDTAKRYGLKNDKYFDERLDIEKSTIAAAKYLKNLHALFGKWYLTAIAYNCGEGRLIEGITRLTLDLYVSENPEFQATKEYREYRNIINKYQTKHSNYSELYRVYEEVKKFKINFTLSDLLSVQDGESRQYIPLESRNHIKKIVSFAMMMNKQFELNEQNPHLLNRGVSKMIVPIQAKGGVHLRSIAEVAKVNYDDLLSINRHLKQQFIPLDKSTYQIYLPYYALNTYQQNEGSIKQIEYHTHIVGKGENLGKIALLYGVSYKTIKNYNKLTSDNLKLKQELIIPIPKDSIKSNNKIAVSEPKKAKKRVEYTVKKGDTLKSIALINKIALNKLISDNKLKSMTIFEGDKLVINY